MTQHPAGWGRDGLSAFFDVARNNLFASFQGRRADYGTVLEIDTAFLTLLSEWKDPESIAAAPFAFRAHSAFRAAAQLVLSGQLPEAFMVMRGVLENALYANHIDVSDTALDIWLNRGSSDESRRKCANEFAGRNLFGSLRGRDKRLGDIAGEMYDHTIDYGAHPNEGAIMASLAIEETATHTAFSLSYIAGNGSPMELALRSLCRVGLMTLDTLCLVFPVQAAERGVQTRLAAVKQGL